MEEHREAVGLLAAGARSDPDREGALVTPGLEQLGQHPLSQGVERAGVAEERGLVRGHRVEDRATHVGTALGTQQTHQLGRPGQLELADDGQEARLQEAALAVPHDDAELVEHELAQPGLIFAAEFHDPFNSPSDGPGDCRGWPCGPPPPRVAPECL